MTTASRVSSAQWTTPRKNTIAAVIDGVTYYVPDDPKNIERILIAQWEAAGNSIKDADLGAKT